MPLVLQGQYLIGELFTRIYYVPRTQQVIKKRLFIVNQCMVRTGIEAEP